MNPKALWRPLCQFAVLLGSVVLSHSMAAQTQDLPASQDGNQPIPPSLPQVQVTDIDGFMKRLSRASVTTTILSGSAIEDLGTRSFVDCLRIVPGMEVEKISASESSLSVRSYTEGGAASQGILGLQDGRQVYNEFFGGVFWENLPLSMDEIKKIEIIRGPGSFIYGPNALHGLVNIVTRSPLDYGEGEYSKLFFSGSAGSYRSDVESLVYVKREGDSALKVKVGHDDMDQFDERDNAKGKSYFEACFQTAFSRDNRLEVAGGASYQKFDVLITPSSVLEPATFSSRALESYVRAKYTDSGLRVQANWTHFDGVGTPDVLYSPFALLLDTADVDADYSIPLFSNHILRAGIGYRYATFITSHPDISDGRHGTSLGWFFIEDEIALTQSLFVTAGGRLDDHSVAGVTLAPRLALVWEFQDDQSFRATAGYGFRDPSLRELWLQMPLTNGLTIIGNREQKPEEMRSFEVGYWGRPTGGFQLEASLYYNLADRLARFELSPTVPNAIQRLNVDKDDAYGVETNIEYQMTREVYTFADYAYEIRRDRETERRVPGGPRNKASAGLRVKPAQDPKGKPLDGLSGMLWVTFFDRSDFVDRTFGTPQGSTPAYTLLNARVWYPVKFGAAEGRIFVEGFNLLDHVHQEHPQGDFYGVIAMAGLEIAY